MFSNMLELFKNPVTYMLEQSKTESLKSSSIKTIISTFILALIRLISNVIEIFSLYPGDDWAQQRNFALKNEKLLQSLLSDWLIFIAFIIVFALIFLVITKFLQHNHTFSTTLSMVGNASVLYTIGAIFAKILYYIYAPLGNLALTAIVAYSVLSLINSFKDSLNTESTDKLVQISTLILICSIIIITIALSKTIDVPLKNLSFDAIRKAF